ncbi:MAG TPA: formimidoylglutamate deiminase [Steroidobacteraceae bacterium]|jgi:formiminoglutamate deiminase|nr:formimidoylglutamate deiminase [Steroidobacteraceae bacterium]
MSEGAPKLWFESALLPSGWSRRVRVTGLDGVICAVEVDVDPSDDDERHAIAIPGLPNLHSHAFQRAIAGLTERRGPTEDSFWTWRELMYRFVERMDPDHLEAITALAFAEMLEAGFTRVGEFHYIHQDRSGVPFADPGELAGRVVAAAAGTGIALTLLPAFYAHGGFGGSEPSVRQRRFVTDFERFGRIVESSRKAVRALTGASVGVAPHSLRAVTPEELPDVVALASGGPVHIHVAEQVREVEECVAWCGRRPIERLFEATTVDDKWCLVHATHVTSWELERIAAAGAVVGLCPITEASLGDGVFPALEFQAFGGRLGIGTDSNVLLDAGAELRALEYSQRLTRRARNVMAGDSGHSTGRSLFDAALAAGAQALCGAGARDRVGLAADGPLDLVSLDAAHPALIERHEDEILDSWIFAAGRDTIDCVWRAGEKVVSAGRHRDREAIVARYRRAMKTLLA